MKRAVPVAVGLLGAAFGIGAAVVIAKKKRGAGFGLSPTETIRTSAGTLRHYKGRLPIQQRVFLIQKMVANGVRDPRMRKLALQITANCPARDGECEARAVHEWVAENVRYSGDVGAVVVEPEFGKPRKEAEPVDLYSTPSRSIEAGGGDCDDATAVNASLLALNGIDAEMDVSSNECKTHDHIFAVAKLPKNRPTRRVPVDTTLGPGQFGVWPRYCAKITFPA